jgi:glycosyltransferase involved in cell wall biosynthesis
MSVSNDSFEGNGEEDGDRRRLDVCAMDECRVSVIVPACNAASDLPHCLEALRRERAGGFEIIVVDDASTDDTARIAESMDARVFRRERNAGPSAARNLGARHARGEYLFFVDADVVVQEGAVSRVRGFLDRNPAVSAVFGSYDAQPRAKGLITQYRNLLHHFVHQHGRRDATTFWSGCGAIRRSVFLETGGFDEVSFPRSIEDIELGYRLRQAGHVIVLDRELLGTHLKRWTFRSLIRTDVFCRAIPWARLNLERKMRPDDLNIKRSQKVSVALTAIAFLCLPLSLVSPWFLAAGAIAALAIIVLNGSLFRFFHERHGPFFALMCIPFHLLYYFYSGLSFVYVWLAHKLGWQVIDGNRPLEQ